MNATLESVAAPARRASRKSNAMAVRPRADYAAKMSRLSSGRPIHDFGVNNPFAQLGQFLLHGRNA